MNIMDRKVTIAKWILAGLLVAIVGALAYVPLVVAISTGEPRMVPVTLFQHPGMPGPANPGAKAVFYIAGLLAFLVATVRLPPRYGVVTSVVIWGGSMLMTIGNVRGLVNGWVRLPAWLLLAAGTAVASFLAGFTLVELLRSRK